MRFSSQADQIGHSVANAATFLRSCVAQDPSSGVGLRHSLLRFGTTASVMK